MLSGLSLHVSRSTPAEATAIELGLTLEEPYVRFGEGRARAYSIRKAIMSDKLQIKQVKNKQPHKAFKADIEDGNHLYDLCKFLRKQKDKRIDIIIDGKRVAFNSIASRKKYAEGFERATDILVGQIKQFAEETFAKINSLTSELDKTKQELKKAKAEYKKTVDNYRVKSAVIDLRQAAWEDRVAELEEACQILSRENKRLEKGLSNTDDSNEPT